MPDQPETAPQDPSPDIEVEVAPPDPEAAPTDSEGAEADPVTAGLRMKVKLLEAQLEESFARSRDTQTKLRDEHERLLRTAAEFENFKRRAGKEKEDLQKFGNERLLKDFLPVADNLDRALDHADGHDPKHVAELITGVQLVQKMLLQSLAKHGVVSFSALGQPFDPAVHEALMQQESDQPPGTVVVEMAKGYKLNERMVRPAAVVVAKARSAPATEAADPANGDASPGNEQTSSPDVKNG